MDVGIPRDLSAALDADRIPPDLSAVLESDVATDADCYASEADGALTVDYIKK